MSGNENSGRKEKHIDKEQLQKLLAMGCTQEEIAAFFNVSPGLISQRKADPEYAEIFATSKLKMHVSIRQWQFDAARKGNSALLIWLGKTMLGQKDQLNVYNHKPISEWTEEELRNAIVERGGNPDAIIAGALAGRDSEGINKPH